MANHTRIWTVALAAALGLGGGVFGADNELANPGFEETAAGKLTGWKPYGRGYTLDRDTLHGGQHAARCECPAEREGTGLAQVIVYEKPDKRPIILGGWSKAEGVGSGGDYGLYLDVIYDDGSPWWGKRSDWARGTHDWQYTAAVFWPQKPVREIRAYVFLRRTTGKAWFDDVFLARQGLHVTQVRATSDYPHTLHGQRLYAQLTHDADWRCAFVDAAGQELDTVQGHGQKIAWSWLNPSGAAATKARITARTSRGEQVDLDLPVSATARHAENPVRKGYVAWFESPMRKVYPTEYPPAKPQGEARIALAHNERESLQLAITPADDQPLRNVEVTLGKFVDGEGRVFSADRIERHLVGYVYVDSPSGHPDAPAASNWCPDVLLPARPFDVPGGRTQTVWINFFAADAVAAGTYRGTVRVQPAGATAVELPVQVQVRRFSLPRTPRMKTAFAIMDGYLKAAYGQITPELRRRSLDLMLSHRLNPDDISRTEPPAIDDLLYARRNGLNTFNILNLVPKPKGEPLWTCLAPLDAYKPDFTAELAARLDGYMAELRSRGLARIAYFYGFDERGPEYDALIRRVCKFLKERYPEVATFTTAGYMYKNRKEAKPDDQDYMDWYCPLTPVYDRELSAELRAQGKKVWWYVCCGPRHPYANFASMDYPSIEGRLLAWMTFGYEADGLLYWHVNLWHPNKIIAGHDPYIDWNVACIANMSGDGCLAYPTPDGPVSSIRLENIRDGLEDFDYLTLLADAQGRAAAQKFVEQLVTSLTQFSRDPSQLSAVREELARQIEIEWDKSSLPPAQR